MPDRYWVGGTAAWDGTAGSKWATTSGGAGGASVPTTSDDVFFDANSSGTCTISSGNTGAKSINCTGFTGGLTCNASITLAGSLTLVAGMTYTHSSGVYTFTGTGTITTAGNTIFGVIINGSGITVTLGDAINMSTGNLNVTQGTFDTANYNVTCGQLISSNSNTRTITLGSSTVTLSAGIGGALDFSTTTNLTFNANTSQLTFINSSASFRGGGQTFYNVSFTNTSTGTRTITDSNTFNNLTFNASATGLSQLSVSANQTVNGTFTCAGSSATARGFVRSDTIGTSRTITAATLSANDCDFRDITIAGGAAGTAPTRAGDCGGNSGITFSSKSVYWNLSGTQNWNATAWAGTSNGSPDLNNFPLAQDTAYFTNDGAAGTVTISSSTSYNFPTIDASARTSAMTLSHTSSGSFYGSYILGTGVTASSGGNLSMLGRGSHTFSCAGQTLGMFVVFSSVGGTYTLGDAFSSNANTATQITSGTFDAATYNVTVRAFSVSSLTNRTLNMGSGLWTLIGTGTVWTGSTTNLTLNKGTADILLSDNTATSRAFSGAGQSFNKITIGGTTSTSTTSFTTSATFSEIASTKTVAHTITLASGTTLTVDTWSVTGTPGNVVTINSSAAGGTRSLVKSGGGFLTGIDYLNVRDVVGSPVSDTWYIGSNSVYNTTSPNTARGFFLTQRADNAIVVLEDTTSSSWTVPNDWNNSSNTIHLIGGGGGGAGGRASSNNRAGGGGGGGGGYTQLTNQTLTIGASITYQAGSAGTVGAAGNNGGAGGTTSWNAGAATAGGGGGGQAVATPPSSTGGTAGSGSTYNGGVGGQGSAQNASSTGHGGGGGAGAAGPNGAGGTGGDGFASTTAANIAGGGGGGNGGGSNGGNASSATGGTGGNNSLGGGGGASNTSGILGGGGGGSTSAASVGGIGIDVFGVGSGGGGGGEDDADTTNTGGIYGAGGGGGGVNTTGTARAGSAGAQGAIIIVYTPGGAAPTATGNMFFMFN